MMVAQNGWFHKAQLLAILAVIAQMLLAIVWMVWPYQVFEIQQLRVIESAVAPGDHVVLQMHYCQFGERSAEVHYTYNDDVGYGLLGEVVSTLPAGCGVNSEVIPVPMLPAGDYHLEMSRMYSVNPLRSVIVRGRSNQFYITPGR